MNFAQILHSHSGPKH